MSISKSFKIGIEAIQTTGEEKRMRGWPKHLRLEPTASFIPRHPPLDVMKLHHIARGTYAVPYLAVTQWYSAVISRGFIPPSAKADDRASNTRAANGILCDAVDVRD